MKRSAGIIMPISSLPSPYGIGTFGKAAKSFVDFLASAKQSYWQILPLGPTGYGDSPYQSFCSFAGNPYFIDFDELRKEGYLQKSDYADLNWGSDETKIDYGLLYTQRYIVLRKAVFRMLKENSKHFQGFTKKEKGWLNDYALFMAIKTKYKGLPFREWPDKLRIHDKKALRQFMKDNREEVDFYKGVQYFFYVQWFRLKRYANKRGIRIIGDLPIYVAEDSVELWSDPKQFQVTRDGNLKEVAGYPPGNPEDDGQRWGNPLYDWAAMEKDGYKWWIRRIKAQTRLYDVIRLDHFQGFSNYYAIPSSCVTAKIGKWKKGPGISLFRAIQDELGKMSFIVEDLGMLHEEAYKLKEEAGYPGMKTLQYAFYPENPSSEYLPHNFIPNCVVYVSTHDTEPIGGWFEDADSKLTDRAIEYLHLDKQEGYNWGMIRGAYAGCEVLAVAQMQDFLGLGKEARINDPGKATDNWNWRAKKIYFNRKLANRISRMVLLYDRWHN